MPYAEELQKLDLAKAGTSKTCLCRSAGKVGRWLSLSPNWTPLTETNQPRKALVAGIIWSRRVAASDLRTATENSQSIAAVDGLTRICRVACRNRRRHDLVAHGDSDA